MRNIVDFGATRFYIGNDPPQPGFVQLFLLELGSGEWLLKKSDILTSFFKHIEGEHQI